MKKLSIKEIPGVVILSNFFHEIPDFKYFKIEEIRIYGYGDELNQIDIKLTIKKPIDKKPKKWLRKDYEYLGILLECVNVESFNIKKSGKNNISVNVYIDEKYFYLEIIQDDSKILFIKSETVCFENPEGLLNLQMVAREI